MNSYKPGESVRLLAQADQLGSPVNVSPLFVLVHSPDGVPQVTPAILNDATGTYHADFAVPLGAIPGTWIYRWWTTSVTPGLNALAEAAFIVQPLAF